MASAGMRDNFSGDISIAAPTGGVIAGKFYLIGAAYMVARETKDAAAIALFAKRGPVWVTKATTTGVSFAVGAKVYGVASTHIVGIVTTGNILVGYAVAAAATTDTLVLVDWMYDGSVAG